MRERLAGLTRPRTAVKSEIVVRIRVAMSKVLAAEIQMAKSDTCDKFAMAMAIGLFGVAWAV